MYKRLVEIENKSSMVVDSNKYIDHGNSNEHTKSYEVGA